MWLFPGGRCGGGGNRDLVEGDDVIESVLGTCDVAHGDLGFCDHQSVVE